MISFKSGSVLHQNFGLKVAPEESSQGAHFRNGLSCGENEWLREMFLFHISNLEMDLRAFSFLQPVTSVWRKLEIYQRSQLTDGIKKLTVLNTEKKCAGIYYTGSNG